MNKNKILNDPVYGFVTIHSDLVFDIIEHPYFQRLRRIKQLGLTDLVYPGALHTRFHHAIGAMHLMRNTLDNLRSKGHFLWDQEMEAAQIAILLHDIGHGPFSHALEFSLLKGIPHEKLSLQIMEELNRHFKGKLDLAIQIFTGRYPRKFFNELVSSQLDIDRLDYLKRDSFFTGVSEGTIGADRIIKMLEVHEDALVVEEKGIYSIENFLSARRLMYWQVYLHKATVSAEKMLISVIKRARDLVRSGHEVFASPALKLFLEEEVTLSRFKEEPHFLEAFCQLDDYDIWGGIKIWSRHEDAILSRLSNMLLHRKLFKVILSNEEAEQEDLDRLKERIMEAFSISEEEVGYFLVYGSMSNSAYLAGGQTINVLTKSGDVMDVAAASDLPNIKAMSKIVRKYYICWPKSVPFD
ncbi:HD domain-containing protein [Roseivirga sp. BDSF3-8]|uniref:HD domain-containing protein n=1 Tax=Roseivirga sp. BDSF3-8 TaxID=3241598 RepID=UPI0035318F20